MTAVLGGVASRLVWRGWEAITKAGAIRSGGRHARRFGAFGAGSVICFPVASLVGEDRMAIGAGSVIGPYSTVSAGLPGQPPNPWWAGPTLVIGDRCVLGRNITITAHRLIRFGDDVWTGNGVFVSDQNHGWDDPALPIGTQAQEPQPVEIGDGAWLGHGVAVLPGVRIGRGSVIGAGAVVTTDVPDRAVAVGVPARVVRLLDEPAADAGSTIVPLT